MYFAYFQKCRGGIEPFEYWLGCGLDLRNRGSTRGRGKIVTSSLKRLVPLWGPRKPFLLVRGAL